MALDGGIHTVHALCAGPRGVFAVHDVLHHPTKLCSLRRTLVGHLVADAPHHDRRVVAVMTHHIHQIAFHPLVVVLVITIGHFLGFPLIESLHHQQHPHLVAGLHQFRRRHVVRRTIGIAAHVLQHLQPVTDGLHVHRRAQRSQVVMIARAVENQFFPVQQEAFFGDDFNRTDAERSLVGIAQTSLIVHLRVRPVKVRIFAIPQQGAVHHEILFEHTFVIRRQGGFALRHFLSSGSTQDGFQTDVLAVRAVGIFQFRTHLHFRKILTHRRRGDGRAPCTYPDFARHDQMHVPVQPGPRIPARAFGFILQAHRQHIVFCVHGIRHVEIKRIIAVRPIPHLLSVDIDLRVAHRPVEHQHHALARTETGHVEMQPVPAYANERQSSRTSGLVLGFFLSVLLDGHELPVVVRIERPAYRPIVGHGHAFPLSVVHLHSAERSVVCTGKPPSVPQQHRFPFSTGLHPQTEEQAPHIQ